MQNHVLAEQNQEQKMLLGEVLSTQFGPNKKGSQDKKKDDDAGPQAQATSWWGQRRERADANKAIVDAKKEMGEARGAGVEVAVGRRDGLEQRLAQLKEDQRGRNEAASEASKQAWTEARTEAQKRTKSFGVAAARPFKAVGTYAASSSPCHLCQIGLRNPEDSKLNAEEEAALRDNIRKYQCQSHTGTALRKGVGALGRGVGVLGSNVGAAAVNTAKGMGKVWSDSRLRASNEKKKALMGKWTAAVAEANNVQMISGKLNQGGRGGVNGPIGETWFALITACNKLERDIGAGDWAPKGVRARSGGWQLYNMFADLVNENFVEKSEGGDPINGVETELAFISPLFRFEEENPTFKKLYNVLNAQLQGGQQGGRSRKKSRKSSRKRNSARKTQKGGRRRSANKAKSQPRRRSANKLQRGGRRRSVRKNSRTRR